MKSKNRVLKIATTMATIFLTCSQSVKAANSYTLERAGPAAATETTARILVDRIAVRTGLKPVSAGEVIIELRVDPKADLSAEGYRLARDGSRTVITGQDRRGLLYGAGKFLRTSTFAKGEFTPSAWTGVSAPEMPVRIAYFASHYGNYYENAPIDELRRYIEDLGLWGYNGVSIWFHKTTHRGLQDEHARKTLKHLAAILKAVDETGLDASLMECANAGYAPDTIPEGLGSTAGPHVRAGRWVCPSRPGGMEHILAVARTELDFLKRENVPIRNFVFWPYDDGGCQCEQCRPWGGNGYLKAAKSYAALAKERYPDAKVGIGSWRLEPAEWASLTRAGASGDLSYLDFILDDTSGPGKRNGGVDYIHENGVPGDKPLLLFAQISMGHGQYAWGGYGAQLSIGPFIEYWNRFQKSGLPVTGIIPYSEGRYEDLQKVLLAQLAWSPQRDPWDIVHEYAANLTSPDHAELVVEALHLDQERRFTEANQIVTMIDAALPDPIREAFPWRVFRIRHAVEELRANKAAIDLEKSLAEGQAVHTPEAAKLLGELKKLYHVNDRTSRQVMPGFSDKKIAAQLQAAKKIRSGKSPCSSH